MALDYTDPKVVTALIIQAAQKHGVDPHLALGIAQKEGALGRSYNGDRDATGAYTSFGPLQLHYAGHGGGMGSGGLGEEFTAKYGVHASDPSTTPQQIDFGVAKMAQAMKSGGLDAVGDIWHALRNNGVDTVMAAGKNALAKYGGGVADVAADFSGRVGSDLSSLQERQQKILEQLQHLMSQGYQAPEYRPGLLGQLLFGDKGLTGLIHEHMPNGILGGLSNQLHSSLPNGLLGGLFGLGSAHAAPVAQPLGQPADVPTPPERPLVMANNLPPMHIGDGGQIHNDANQAVLDARANVPLPPARPLNLAGNTLPDITIPAPQQTGSLGGLDALQGLFGGMLG